MSPQAFARCVRDALDALPKPIAAWIDNVEVVVEDWPTRRQMRDAGVSARGELLGLYEGIPLTERTSGYGMVVPDRITLFRGPILAVAQTPEQVTDEIRITVIHELAHHFGIDDDRLIELGAY